MNIESSLEELNNEQREAVLYCQGHSLILAGAGSGKTRVLTTKVAYLIAQGYAPYSILALTFTNKAAREMRERIASTVGRSVAQMIPMGTFHSIFSRLLRHYASHIGFTSSYTIYDTADSRALLKSIIKDMKLDEKQYRPNTVQSIISGAKNNMISAKQYALSPTLTDADRKRQMPRVKDIFLLYSERCIAANAMDFDDLLLYTYKLLNEHKEAREELQDRYKFILVDEYQDTNRVQHQIVKFLCGEDCTVCVVGDDSQSIYSFRGARIDNILNFRKSFENAALFKLTKNYRSTSNIVDLASGLIEKNTQRIPKEVVSVKGPGQKTTLLSAYSANIEAQAVGARILNLIQESGADPEDIAILYRTNAQSRILEDQIRVLGIKLRIYGGMSFYERKEVKDVIAYLRLLVNMDDDEAFRRIYNMPARGIGATSFEQLHKFAQEKGCSYMNAIVNEPELGNALKPAAVKKFRAFADMILGFKEESKSTTLLLLAQSILQKSGLYTLLDSDKTPEGEDRKQNVSELLNAIDEYTALKEDEGVEAPTPEEYLQEVALYTDRDQDEKDDSPKVTLMTMHTSKGLEYDYVFIVGVEDGLIPSERSIDTVNGVEEERRLLYVAITRAKIECCISFAYSRSSYGKYVQSFPSRFLYDLDEKFINNESDFRFRKERSASPFLAKPVIREKKLEPLKEAPQSATTQALSYKEGDRVNHHIFGNGTVQEMVQSDHGIKIKIIFDTEGEKLLIARYAKLTPIQ
ncbi:MAG: UvrD-helicase domain-containing protein [Porphyromonas sp.]|nr:UvrD-helicase domain-containing protein [Porphyromonas sp.]